MQLNTSNALVAAGNRVTAVYRGSNVVYSLEPVAPATGLFLGSQPQDATAVNGQAQFVTSASEAGGGTVAYQWQRKPVGGAFADASGATSPTLTLAGLTKAANNGDAYRAVITGSSGGTVTTREATLTVPSPLSITQQPTNQTTVNRAASFSVTATHSGGLAISYQWQESTDGQSWGNLPGGTSATLSFLSVPYEYDGKRYRVVLSSPDGETITSFTAVLTVPPSPIQIVQQPTNQTAVNLSATFTVSAAHSQALPMTYQWEESLDGGNVWYLMDGMTGTQLQFITLPYDYDGRMYRAVVSSGAEYAISNAAVLTDPPSPVSIALQPQSVSVTVGENASFSVQATHSQGLALSYQWAESDDGGNMWYELEGPSATTNVLTLESLPEAKDGTLIRVEVFDANGQYAISNSATLSVSPVPDGQPPQWGDPLRFVAGSAYSKAGASMSFSQDGGVLAIGEPNYYDQTSAGYLGRVSVYAVSYSGAVPSVALLGAPVLGDAQLEATFPRLTGEGNQRRLGAGVALSADGSRLLVYSARIGYARVYDYVAGQWVQVAQTIGPMFFTDAYGSPCAISGDGSTIALCAPYEVNGAYYAARRLIAYRYVAGEWVEISFADASGANAHSIGVALSGDGSRLFAASDSGTVREYRYNAATQVYDAGQFASLATTVQSPLAVSSDGGTLAVGSPFYSVAKGTSGLVSIFSADGAPGTALTLSQTIQSPLLNTASTSPFGVRLALSAYGNVLAVGGTFNTVNVFRRVEGMFADPPTAFTALATNSFYETVAISGDSQSLATARPESQATSPTVDVYRNG